MVRCAIRGVCDLVLGYLRMYEPGVRLAGGRLRKSLKRVSLLGLSMGKDPEYGDVCGYFRSICLARPMALRRWHSIPIIVIE